MRPVEWISAVRSVAEKRFDGAGPAMRPYKSAECSAHPDSIRLTGYGGVARDLEVLQADKTSYRAIQGSRNSRVSERSMKVDVQCFEQVRNRHLDVQGCNSSRAIAYNPIPTTARVHILHPPVQSARPLARPARAQEDRLQCAELQSCSDSRAIPARSCRRGKVILYRLQDWRTWSTRVCCRCCWGGKGEEGEAGV